MIELYDNATDDLIGTIDSDQLYYLESELQEVSESGREYSVGEADIVALEEAGADELLVEMLFDALGAGERIEVRCEYSG